LKIVDQADQEASKHLALLFGPVVQGIAEMSAAEIVEPPGDAQALCGRLDEHDSAMVRTRPSPHQPPFLERLDLPADRPSVQTG
jgi:hypothetical protein